MEREEMFSSPEKEDNHLAHPPLLMVLESREE